MTFEAEPNPVPHWHVSRPPWATEKGQRKKRIVTVWPNRSWAENYIRKLPERWAVFNRSYGGRRKVCFEEDGRDKQTVSLTVPNAPDNKASLWQCLKTDCYEGIGVED